MAREIVKNMGLGDILITPHGACKAIVLFNPQGRPRQAYMMLATGFQAGVLSVEDLAEQLRDAEEEGTPWHIY